MEMERRDFLKGAAVGAMGMLPLGMVVGCSPAESSGADEASAGQSNAPEMSQVVNEEGRLLTLDEVNQMRQELIDSKEDYVKADGTVVPALYVKVRALINSTGMGVGNEINDESFDAVMMDFTEEQAEAYLEMPWGVHFTATDFAVKAGRDEAECYDLCEKMGYEGLLHRAWKGGVPYYYTLPEIHGIWEFGQKKMNPEYIIAHKDLRPDRNYVFFNAGTPNYYSIPLNKDVVAEEGILPYDDLDAILNRNEVFGLGKCICVLQKEMLDMRGDCPHELEKCVVIGEAAEFSIENGDARQITREEARAHFDDSIEKGYVLQSCFSRESGSICSCHGDHCGFLSSMVAMGDDFAQNNAAPYVSHYRLQFEQDTCAKCGTCEARCPLYAISMNDEGYPQIAASCIACGQCAYVCPTKSRMLVQKDLTDFPELPEDYLEDANQKAEFRFRNGLIS